MGNPHRGAFLVYGARLGDGRTSALTECASSGPGRGALVLINSYISPSNHPISYRYVIHKCSI